VPINTTGERHSPSPTLRPQYRGFRLPGFGGSLL
jgi:hypothetical protein